MNCIAKFNQIYKKESTDVLFCSYRICPLGAHVEHQVGRITGLAIDKGIHIAYKPKKNGVVEMSSLQFEKLAQWLVNQVPEVKESLLTINMKQNLLN